MFLVYLSISYILGSLNTSIIFSHTALREDVREFYTANAGATNTARAFGKKAGVFVGAVDFIKAYCLVFILKNILIISLYQVLACAFALILGHIFPCWFSFKGGKGVACALGVVTALNPVNALIAAVIFLGFAAVSKKVTVSCIAGGCAYFIMAVIDLIYSAGSAALTFIFSFLMLGLIFFAHRRSKKR